MDIRYILNNLAIRVLPPPISNTLKYRQFLHNGYNVEMWGGGIYSDNLRRALRCNLTDKELQNKRFISRISKDIILSYILLKATPEEYFVFEFRNKSHQQRLEYLTNWEKDLVLMRKIPEELIKRLRDKWKTYILLKDIYQREAIRVTDSTDANKYHDFISRHDTYIAKPLEGMCGRGVGIFSGDRFNEIFSKGSWILEEVVTQSATLACFNPESVNTVRFPTFYKNGVFTPFAPFFRTGRKGSVVDNGGAGGVFSALDVKTGYIITDGFDEDNKRYELHPDSGVKFKGFRIPQWKELIETARKAHEHLSNQQYIAWDFALTDKGWVLIEANSMGQFLWQYATKKGVRNKFLELMS